jgi:hypothetical protein
MGTTAFLALMARFRAHLKLTASKWFARRKIKQLEDKAAEDKDKTTSKDKRNLNWEITPLSYGKWD